MTANLTIETFPNEAAADYIHGKAVADPKNFGNLPDQLKQRAFTVAGIEQMDALRRMRDAIAKLPEGASWDEAKKEIAAEISPFTGGDMKAARAGEDGNERCRYDTILRLGRAGFIDVVRVAPNTILLDLDSWYRHLADCMDDPDRWDEGGEDREAYLKANGLGGWKRYV